MTDFDWLYSCPALKSHRIPEWFELEGTIKLICHGQEFLPLCQMLRAPYNLWMQEQFKWVDFDLIEYRADPEISQDTHENSISLFPFISLRIWDPQPQAPCSLVCFQSRHPLWNTSWWVFDQAAHCSRLPLCMVTSRKVCGCARQQQGLKCWCGGSFTVDVAVACSWTSPVCKDGTLASPYQR